MIWMFCRTTYSTKIEKIYHKALPNIYNNTAPHEKLPLSNEISIHQALSRLLTTEIYKLISNIRPVFMSPYFVFKDLPYNLLNEPNLGLAPARSTHYFVTSVLIQACLI